MNKALVKYNWRYEYRPHVLWWLTQVASGLGIGVGFAIGQWALSCL